MTSSIPRRAMRSSSGARGSWARTVVGPGSITSSTGVASAASSRQVWTRPSTIWWSLVTTRLRASLVPHVRHRSGTWRRVISSTSPRIARPGSRRCWAAVIQCGRLEIRAVERLRVQRASQVAAIHSMSVASSLDSQRARASIRARGRPQRQPFGAPGSLSRGVAGIVEAVA